MTKGLIKLTSRQPDDARAAQARLPARKVAFCASTGRTATTFLAATLNALPDVIALHEGQLPDKERTPQLPLINFHARKAWFDPAFARQLVADMRGGDAIAQAAGDACLLVDIAFNNAPFLDALADQHPTARLLAIFRRCEGFVRSATIVEGEDDQPAGWPAPDKPLSDREKFISMGRLKPQKGTPEDQSWPSWTAIQRNIWLWSATNVHLLERTRTLPNCHPVIYEDLSADPEKFWTILLTHLDHFTPDTLARCVERSVAKVNTRTSYQVGPADTWSGPERDLYQRLALPLENEIYG
ncbi:hypothetical protein [uncultured Tateyamaria sp.]|uniref:hypothetical protein n=1 Tax=uncultured Tateyamaria sp. TaxID=455651 RepID=UPI002631F33C|nr:hypothetical protein [uncultured Tateyamaria sp.]